MKCRKQLKPVFRSDFADKEFAKLSIVYFLSWNHLLLKSYSHDRQGLAAHEIRKIIPFRMI